MKRFTDELTLFALAVVSLAGRAGAEQITVLETSLDNWRQEVSAKFATNRDLGRAWIDVLVTAIAAGEEPEAPEVISKELEGLYYDRGLKQVLYRNGNESIVCAADSPFLWSTYLKNTGQCLLTQHSEKRKIDDGFKVRERTVHKVVFEVRPSIASPRLTAARDQATSGAQRSGEARAEGGAQGASGGTVVAEQLKGVEISLERGLSASAAEGKPISAKFEVEDGKLQLSIYVAKGASFSELIVDHKTGKIAQAEPITGGDDLASAMAQGEAMTKARTSLQEALAKAVAANQAYRAVSVTSALKDDRPIAYITLSKGTESKTITERLD